MQQGEPKWAFETFRRECISAFLRDLRSLEVCGLDRLPCQAVQAYLIDISKILKPIPIARPPGKSVATDFEEFAALYEEWNNKKGDTPEMRKIRARAYENLKRKRNRLRDRISDSLPKLDNSAISWKIVDELYGTFHKLVSDKLLLGKFNSLESSLKGFDSKIRQYRP